MLVLLRSSRKRRSKSMADDRTMLIFKIKIVRESVLRETKKCLYKWAPVIEDDSFSERGNVQCLGSAFVLTTK